MNAKKIGIKAFVLILALVLLIGCVAGGTVAYLMTKSDTVTNTFVAGNIGTLKLTETPADSFIVVPGHNIAKDPTVTFSGNNVDAYVFLKVDAAGWTYAKVGDAHVYYMGDAYGVVGGKRVEAVIDSGWTYLGDNVFYRTVTANSTGNTFAVIENNTITVDSTITQGNIQGFIDDYNEATEGSLTIETFSTSLTFTAYAIQMEGTAGNDFEPAEAWALLDEKY